MRKSGWHIDCISEHLEAVEAGQITRLLINMPPRHMKSLTCSVFFPAWVWLRRPETQFLYASYVDTLSIRDCRKSRNIILSSEYQEMIGKDAEGAPHWGLSADQNVKRRYDNTETGHRIATSVDGAATGDGGDIIVVDDPHKVKEAESVVQREAVLEWWDETMSTRLNNPETGVYIVIMQRVHEKDLAGHILAKDSDEEYVHLCLPAEYEGENRIKSPLIKKDPRKKKGELLWPEQFSKKQLKRLKKDLTLYAQAGQLQQRPAPREGGMFTKEDFVIISRRQFNPNDVLKTVRYWDKAGTKDGGCQTAGVRMHLMKDGSFVVSDSIVGHWSYGSRESRIKIAAKLDHEIFYDDKVRNSYQVYVEQEPGSAGKESADRTVKKLAKVATCRKDKVTGSKEVRAEPYSGQVEASNVFVVKGKFTENFIEEHGLFPNGEFKDQVDAAAGAYMALTDKKPQAGTW